MKRIFTISTFFIFLVSNAWAQMGYTAPKTAVTVMIEDNSYLKIEGRTNVNNFSCGYRDEIPQDTMAISISQSEGKALLTNAEMKVPVKGLDCGNAMMNSDLQNLLQQDKHPEIIIRIKSLEPSEQLMGGVDETGFIDAGHAIVEFEIAGVANEYRIPLNSYNELIDQYFLGKKTINIKDFNLSPPKKFLGLVKVEEEITIDFRLNLDFLY